MPKVISKIPFNYFTVPVKNEYNEDKFYFLIDTGAGHFFVDKLSDLTDTDRWRKMATAPKWFKEGLVDLRASEVNSSKEVETKEETEDAGFE